MKHKPTQKISKSNITCHMQIRTTKKKIIIIAASKQLHPTTVSLYPTNPSHSAAKHQLVKRNHQIDFKFFTTFLVLLTKILSHLEISETHEAKLTTNREQTKAIIKNLRKKKCLFASIQPMASNTIALFQSQIPQQQHHLQI